MKKILIISQAMEIGGAEKALLGLLENIDIEKYQVDLFLMRHTGELLKYIPKGIKLLPEKSEYAMLGIPIRDILRSNVPIFLRRLYGRLRALFYCRKNKIISTEGIEDLYSHKFTIDTMPPINEEKYDLAISFLAPHYIIDKKVKATKKIGWIHTDYETLEIDQKSELQMWSKLDNIISISENVSTSFLKVFPSLKNKILQIQNIVPVKYMEALTQEGNVEYEMINDGTVRLLSVGRFCNAKNFDNIPEICSLILDKGIAITWYLIGYGPDEALIRNKIIECGMEKHIIILGKKENPYPYFKRCDIYVQPSRFEGKCVSVIEAQMLNKPVIITDYATSGSQLEDGVDGVIVPMDNTKCAMGIVKLIQNKELQRQIVQTTNCRDYSNSNEINRIYDLFDGV